MPDKFDRKNGSAKPEDDDAVERRVDQMLDPELPDPEPESMGDAATNNSPAKGSNLPPLNIFEDPKTAPAVPKDLLADDDKGAGADTPEAPANDEAPPPPSKPEAAALPDAGGIDDSETDKAVDEIAAKESDAVLAAEDAEIAKAFEPPKKPQGRLRSLLKNKWTWVVVVVALIVAAGLVPFTRYKALGLFMKRDFSVVVLDSETHTAVSGATLTLAGQTAKTDSAGKASLHVPVGHNDLKAEKQYYQSYSSDVLIPPGGMHDPFKVQLVATGRQVPVKVVNKITGQPLENAEIKVLDTEAKTNHKGQATIVLPTDSATQTASISLSGYNTAKVGVQVTGKAVAGNTFQLTPAGKIYFLSNLSGNIDVMKANLDGSGRQMVLKGTGSEDARSTALLASADWQYLALVSKRSGGKHAKLYVINTASGQLETIDDSPASFETIGWHGHDFLYDATNGDAPVWQGGRELLKSYDADSGHLTVLAKSQATGSADAYVYQSFYDFNIVGDNLVYATQWYNVANSGPAPDLSKQKDVIRVVQLSTNSSKDVKTFAGDKVGYIKAVRPTPGAVYFLVDNYVDSSSSYYEFSGGTLKPNRKIDDQTFSKNYPAYLTSPSGAQTFWSELRDGKNTLLVGDAEAGNPKVVATLSRFDPYGWYGNQYLLVSKADSELYVMPAGDTGKHTPLKITDYYKSSFDYGGM